jgi:nucleotide-binding universal stress UspA family protein
MTTPAELAAMAARLNKDLSTIEAGMAVASIPVPQWWEELREAVIAAPKTARLTAVADQLKRAQSQIQQSQITVGQHRDAIPAAWIGQGATEADRFLGQLEEPHAVLADVLGGFSESLYSQYRAWVNFLSRAISKAVTAAVSVAALLYFTQAGGTMGTTTRHAPNVAGTATAEAAEAAAEAAKLAARAAARFFWQVVILVAAVILACIAALWLEWDHFGSVVSMESAKVRELTARVTDQVKWPTPPVAAPAAATSSGPLR